MKSLNICDIPKQLSTGVQVAAKQLSSQRVKNETKCFGNGTKHFENGTLLRCSS